MLLFCTFRVHFTSALECCNWNLHKLILIDIYGELTIILIICKMFLVERWPWLKLYTELGGGHVSQVSGL